MNVFIQSVYINKEITHFSTSFEIRIGEKGFIFLRLYKSPSQTQDIFETFINKNSFLIDAFGDFNVKRTNWCKDDKNS